MKLPFRQRLLRRSLSPSLKWTGIAMAAIFVLIVVVHFVYDIVAPFHPLDPLIQEITIGERVIGQWKYAGVDEAGHIRFYDQFQTVVIPANSQAFDADGDYVIIRAHTPTTLTIEHRTQYASQLGLILLLFVTVAIVLYITLRTRLGRRKRGSPSPFQRKLRLVMIRRRMRK